MADVFPQAGAIPYRITGDTIEVLLISTSSGKHLTIPKGLIDPGFSATDTALNESYEEAGIKGRLLTPVIGRYSFEKWGGDATLTFLSCKSPAFWIGGPKNGCAGGSGRNSGRPPGRSNIPAWAH
jgi:8-oxo-dGTP pyrophosphatase MutT (NUDIX family)